jgi:hypothetical protein
MITGKLPRFFHCSEDLLKDGINYYNDPVAIAKWLLERLKNEPQSKKHIQEHYEARPKQNGNNIRMADNVSSATERKSLYPGTIRQKIIGRTHR